MLRVVIAEGDAATRGRTIGAGMGDLIDRSLLLYRDYFAHLGIHDLAAAVTPFRDAAERSLPEHVELIAAMANASSVPELELFAVNTCEELEAGAVPSNGFNPRCPLAIPECKEIDPELRRPVEATRDAHRAACIRV
jgi:hypothetical protein